MHKDKVDTITMDVPLFLRMLEYAKEDAKTDMDLHNVTEKAIAKAKTGKLTMKDYSNLTTSKDVNEAIQKALIKKIKEDATTKSGKQDYIGRGDKKALDKDYDFRRLNRKTQDELEDELEDGGRVKLENNYPDYEGEMVKSQLISIVKNARDLYNMVDEDTQLEGWVQSKITKAEDYLQAVSSYLYGQATMHSPADFTITENKKKK